MGRDASSEKSIYVHYAFVFGCPRDIRSRDPESALNSDASGVRG